MTKIYNEIGHEYNLTRCADAEIVIRLSKLISLSKSGKYLDVGCGTGNYTRELAKLGGEWTAFDKSELMIEQARYKPSKIDWHCFDVEHIALPDNFFNASICTLALHHFAHLALAMSEVSRVLYPGGRLVIFTSTPKQMRGYWLNHYFPEMMAKAIDQMPTIERIRLACEVAKLELTGVETFSVTNQLKDLFLYSGKERPELYLSSKVRSSISSFRNFCPKVQQEFGLSQLEKDIKSGAIQNIMEKYQNSDGDYCFIVLEKI